MMSLIACGTGFVLDFLFGDPVWLYHPVRLIGALIAGLEKLARRLCGEHKNALLAAGVLLLIIVAGLSTAVPLLMLYGAGRIHPGLSLALESFWCYQLLAAKSLKQESMKVYHEIKKKDLKGARKAVSMIVGRDTESLDEAGVVKAAVETVAENTSDGVTAPLLFMMIGGAPFGFFYKAVNTMDSMIGYKDEKYLYLGRCAAKLDDVLNYIPARLSAVLMTLAAYLLKLDGHRAWSIYLRDKRKHASPNSAQSAFFFASRPSACPPPGQGALFENLPRLWLTFPFSHSIISDAHALVAQLDRASDSDSEGRTFESCRAHQAKSP